MFKESDITITTEYASVSYYESNYTIDKSIIVEEISNMIYSLNPITIEDTYISSSRFFEKHNILLSYKLYMNIDPEELEIKLEDLTLAIFTRRNEYINRCLECGIDMGPQNPRQLCGKSFCRYSGYWQN